MKRTEYYNYIDEKLHTLSSRIKTGGKLNILSLHIHSESFYLNFFNLLFNYNLINLNEEKPNVEAIDLIDHNNKIIIQVSATGIKQKIESALKKDIIKDYSNYTFKFILIAGDASNLRKIYYENPHSISFNPENDIFDVTSILRIISNFNIDKQEEIYEFIKKELGNDVDIVKLDTNLATIINILAQEKWETLDLDQEVNSFEISRKISSNNLVKAKYLIDEYKVYHHKIDTIYSEFDSFGYNKSSSVLAKIRKEYIKRENELDSDELFFHVIEKVRDIVLMSANYDKIPLDELELCIDILVVDAFIRCKIFKNPLNYNYVTS